MAQITFTGLTEAEIELFCQQMKDAGATSCEATKQADGSYNVVVDHPD